MLNIISNFILILFNPKHQRGAACLQIFYVQLVCFDDQHFEEYSIMGLICPVTSPLHQAWINYIELDVIIKAFFML